MLLLILMSFYRSLALTSKDLTSFITNVLRFKIRCCLEIKFAANFKYLSLLELNYKILLCL